MSKGRLSKIFFSYFILFYFLVLKNQKSKIKSWKEKGDIDFQKKKKKRRKKILGAD